MRGTSVDPAAAKAFGLPGDDFPGKKKYLEKTEKTRLFRVFERMEEQRLTKESRRVYATQEMSSMSRIPAKRYVASVLKERLS
jgi:hypothetical protein